MLAAVCSKAAAADGHWFSHMYIMHGWRLCLHLEQRISPVPTVCGNTT
jgi:hypothetical protein